MSNYKSYSLGFIGTGIIMETRILPALAFVVGLEAVGAYDTDSERLNYISKTYSIPACRSLEELFLKCDTVYIATPNCYHVPLAIKALESGVAVLLEKPCADTLEAAEKLENAVLKTDRPLLVGYMHEWNRNNQTAKRLVLEKCIGEVQAFSATFGFYNTELEAWRPLRSKSGPGALADLGIYIISTAMDIFGELPVSCTAKAYPAGDATYGDKFLSGRLDFPDGRWVQLRASFMSDSCEYTIIGTDGLINVENSWAQSGGGCVKLCAGNRIKIIPTEVVDPYEEELSSLKECLDGRTVPEVMGIKRSVTDIRIMDALDRSAAQMGTEIRIKEGKMDA